MSDLVESIDIFSHMVDKSDMVVTRVEGAPLTRGLNVGGDRLVCGR
jgi:hypothetical protein